MRLGIPGLLLGMSSGHGSAITLYDAVKSATLWSTAIAGIFGMLWLLATVPDFDRRRPLRSMLEGVRSTVSALIGCFLISLLMLGGLFLLFLWPTSGEGFLLGGLQGVLVGLALAAAISWLERRGWWQRQANWPKWEEMARGHRRALFRINPPPAPEDRRQVPTGMF